MQTQTDIKEFVRDNFPDLRQFIMDNFPLDAKLLPEDFYEIFLLRLLPRIKSIKDKNEHFRTVKDELLFYFDNEDLPRTSELQKFSDKLFELNYQLNRDIKSERLNKFHKSVGLILMILNIGYIILTILFPDGGFSLGVGFLFFSLILTLTPSLPGYFAFKKPIDSSFETRHYLLLMINLTLILLIMYEIYNYVVTGIKI